MLETEGGRDKQCNIVVQTGENGDKQADETIFKDEVEDWDAYSLCLGLF